MPGTPAARQTLTASITLGNSPPRELRRVATLLTFTESLIIAVLSAKCWVLWYRSAYQVPRALVPGAALQHSARTPSPEVLLNDVRDLLRPRLNLVRTLAFDHHAKQRLGTGIAHEQPTLSIEPLLYAFDGGANLRDGCEIDFLAHAHVQQNLRVGDEIAREIGKRTPGNGHRAQHVERCAQAVAGEEVIGKDDVTRLLAAKRQTALEHFLHHVLVADAATYEADAEPPQRDLEANVAHHRSDERVALQPAFALHLPAAHQEHGVAIHDASLMIDKDSAVAVAVERHTHLAAAFDDRSRKPFRMGGTAIEVDVSAIRTIADEPRRQPETLEQPPRNRRCRAVRAVNGDGEALESRPRVWEHGAHVFQIDSDEIVGRDRGRLPILRHPRIVRDDG